MRFQLSMCDVLTRQKWPVQHIGLYLGNNEVFHCTPEKGEHVSSLDDFSQGEVVTVIKNNIQDAFAIKQRLMARLQSIKNSMKSYKYLSNNCEHAVSRVVSGDPDSPQLKKVVCVVAGLLLFLLVARRK